MAELDHLVYRVPDLAAGVDRFAKDTGIHPQRGGSHTGRGTANYLVGLGGHAYLEIIGPDPGQPDFAGERPFGTASDAAAELVTWAVRTPDIDAAISSARAHGYDPGEAAAMERALPNGGRLRWRLTPDAGAVPFLIDWGAGPHPTGAELPQLRLVEFTIRTRDPEALRSQLDTLGATADLEQGEPVMRATLDTPFGLRTLS